MCSGKALRPKDTGTVVYALPPLPTALMKISFSPGGRVVAYNVRGPGIQFHRDIAFLEVNHALLLHNFEST